ncbi:MAG: hypothetical protein NT018_07715 [Armatimonadetes bacterium]|nr:hypothetical protein [Armatimonadota bacterium]
MEHKEIILSDESAQDTMGAAQAVSRTLDAAIDLLADIQKIVSAGKPKSLRIKFGDKTVAELPLAVTAAAFAAGLAVVLLAKLAVEVVAED